MRPPADGASPHGGAWSSYAYGSPYGFPGAYGFSAPFGSPYGFVGPYGFGGPYRFGGNGRTQALDLELLGTLMTRLTGEFADRLALVEWPGEPPQLVHAHDWVTFPAAERLAAKQTGTYEGRRAIYLGRLTRQKARFVHGRRAAAQGQGSELAFAIYGDGELRRSLQQREGSWQVQFAGPLAWAERGQAFTGASAVFVPSRYEPFGMVVAESMLHRVPVLYPRTSGIAEAVERRTLAWPSVPE